MTTSDAILKWLEENKDWFKPTSIAKKLKIDKGNFSRYMKEGIPEKYLIDIMNIIMPLGFTMDELIAENNKPEVKAKILAERNEPNASSVSWSTPIINPEIPPMPQRSDFDNSIDFAAAKNAWKIKYNQ